MRRIRRHQPDEVVQSPIVRVRRSRPAPVEEPQPRPARVSRTRPVTPTHSPVKSYRGAKYIRAKQAAPSSGKPRFLVDWARPLTWKFAIYMVTSYLYYKLDKSVIPDSDYDQLCKQLAAGYDEFEHQHRHLVDKEQFLAGTGYDIEYPLMVIGAAEHLAAHYAEI